MNAVENKHRHTRKDGQTEMQETEKEMVLEGAPASGRSGEVDKPRRSVFDKWTDRLKEFLDNAE